MRAFRAASCLVLGACGFSPMGNGSQPGGDATSDGSAGSHVDAQPIDVFIPSTGQDGSMCYGTAGAIIVCPLVTPTGTFEVDSTTSIDTDDSGTCVFQAQGSGAPSLCVRSFASITINDKVSIKGSHPLVLLATGSITLNSGGVLDASSAGQSGAGANECPASNNGTSITLTTNGAGGAGGTFGNSGGDGGQGANGTTGGSAAAVASTDHLHGGCRGGDGGGNILSSFGGGGDGGGAIDLIGAQHITLRAGSRVDVSGGGGAGGEGGESGGGGGGTGGMIMLDSPDIQFDPASGLVANGAGGGGGGGMGALSPGSRGSTTTANALDDAPDGGNGGGNGAGAGGHGGSRSDDPSDGGNGNAASGGGGGGGGVGRILTFGSSIDDTDNITPPVSN